MFQELIEKAFLEDCIDEDITTIASIPEELEAVGKLIVKSSGVIAGLKFIPQIFHARDPKVLAELHASDGDFCEKGACLGTFVGPARVLLSVERTALNLLQHLSGIATLTALCVEKTRGTHCKIFDTRKTLPGYRELQKYAVRIGGGTNHRKHLADQILIKNNHLFLVPLPESIRRTKECFPNQKIEIEVESMEDLTIALDLGVDAVLLDNMSVEKVRECVEFTKGRAFLEASGGSRLETIEEYAKTGVDGISIGALTHSARALDIAFRIRPKL